MISTFIWHHVALLDDPAAPTEVQRFCRAIKAWEKGRASTACSTDRQHHSQIFTVRKNELGISHKLLCEIPRKRKRNRICSFLEIQLDALFGRVRFLGLL